MSLCGLKNKWCGYCLGHPIHPLQFIQRSWDLEVFCRAKSTHKNPKPVKSLLSNCQVNRYKFVRQVPRKSFPNSERAVWSGHKTALGQYVLSLPLTSVVPGSRPSPGHNSQELFADFPRPSPPSNSSKILGSKETHCFVVVTGQKRTSSVVGSTSFAQFLKAQFRGIITRTRMKLWISSAEVEWMAFYWLYVPSRGTMPTGVETKAVCREYWMWATFVPSTTHRPTVLSWCEWWWMWNSLANRMGIVIPVICINTNQTRLQIWKSNIAEQIFRFGWKT